MGKSRLVDAAMVDDAVRLGRTLVGHCHPLPDPFPLGPLVEALRDAAPPDGDLNPVVSSLRPWPSTADGDLGDHLRWLARAMATTARQSDRLTSTANRASQACVLGGTGFAAGWAVASDLPWGSDRRDEQRELARAAQRLASAATARGHHRRAATYIARGERICRDLGHPAVRLGLQVATAQLALAEGRWEGLERRAEQLLDEIGNNPQLAVVLELIISSLLVSRGDLTEARQRLLAVHDVAMPRGLLPSFVRSAGELARIELLSGRPESRRRSPVRRPLRRRRSPPRRTLGRGESRPLSGGARRGDRRPARGHPIVLGRRADLALDPAPVQGGPGTPAASPMPPRHG